MPINKDKFKRMMIIVRELQNNATRSHPITTGQLQLRIMDELNTYVSRSSIEKDIHCLRYDEDLGFRVPIKAHKSSFLHTGKPGLWIEKDFKFSEHLAKTWRI